MRVCHKENVPHTVTCNVAVTRNLPCGHSASMKCSGSIHMEICNVPVLVTKDSCTHEFTVPCSNVQKYSSAPCSTQVSKELPCGHTQQIPCFAAPENIFCKSDVPFQLPCSHFATVPCSLPLNRRSASLCKELTRKELLCGHQKWMKCRENPFDVDCGVMTERILKCGHSYLYTCPGKSVEDVDFLCEEKVDRRLPCGHFQKIACSRPDVERCIQEVTRVLECGHSVKTFCWNTSPCCLTEVEKMLMCGHIQLVTCCKNIDLVVCKALVELIHPICSHLQLVPCSLTKNEIEMRGWKCKAEPLKMLYCGHEMRLPCTQEIDETIVCTAMINFELPCHHMVTVECSASYEKFREKCKIPCEEPADCGHLCSLVCHDDKIPHHCQQLVKKQLECGHFKVQ